MNACIKCNNTNVSWNGLWKQCVSCGEVHEKGASVMPNHTIEKSNSLQDIIALPLKSTLMGKLISRLHLIH
ncbi:hypothetical protein [Sulfurovum sp. AR]|uniref:hypothetical protein n=1 Tax=Sulfurovum sp. AR TaxID=1165841 RepID=UPI00025C47F0|nr:hypothetical protein [Sulfurovum sp. AR]EIF50435.1 hypothetical protein SULAR_08132 [Sulfurovum sp. AR]